MVDQAAPEGAEPRLVRAGDELDPAGGVRGLRAVRSGRAGRGDPRVVVGLKGDRRRAPSGATRQTTWRGTSAPRCRRRRPSAAADGAAREVKSSIGGIGSRYRFAPGPGTRPSSVRSVAGGGAGTNAEIRSRSSGVIAMSTAPSAGSSCCEGARPEESARSPPGGRRPTPLPAPPGGSRARPRAPGNAPRPRSSTPPRSGPGTTPGPGSGCPWPLDHAVLAGEQAAAGRAVREHREPRDCAIGRISTSAWRFTRLYIGWIATSGAQPCERLDAERVRDLPGREVRARRVEDLAGRTRSLDGAQRLVESGRVVEAVQVEQRRRGRSSSRRRLASTARTR